jgi:hypothetical protein
MARDIIDLKPFDFDLDIGTINFSGMRISSIWMYPLYWFKLIVLDRAGLYASNPLRVMISTLVCYVFFSIVFMLLSLFTSADIVSALGDPDRLSLVAKSF